MNGSPREPETIENGAPDKRLQVLPSQPSTEN